MRRLNLAYAAVFSVILIGGVTWWGEHSGHYVNNVSLADPVITRSEFTVELEKPIPVDSSDPVIKTRKEEIQRPDQQDTPAKPKPDDFIQTLEPPHPEIDNKAAKIAFGNDGTDPGEHIFNPSQLDQQPAATYQARPIYPDAMWRDGISGEVTVDFVVDPSGAVRNTVAISSSQRSFEGPACTAVGKWKFRPGRKGGHAVFVHMQVPIVFSLGAGDGS